MKNHVIAFLMLFAVMASHAQDDGVEIMNVAKNEFKLNGLFLLLGTFEASYERNLTENSSIGIRLNSF